MQMSYALQRWLHTAVTLVTFDDSKLPRLMSFSVVQNHLARVNDQNEYFWWDHKVIKLTS